MPALWSLLATPLSTASPLLGPLHWVPTWWMREHGKSCRGLSRPGLEMAHMTSTHVPLARFSHRVPPTCKGGWEKDLPVRPQGREGVFGVKIALPLPHDPSVTSRGLRSRPESKDILRLSPSCNRSQRGQPAPAARFQRPTPDGHLLCISGFLVAGPVLLLPVLLAGLL